MAPCLRNGLSVSGGHLHGQSLDRHHLRGLPLSNRGLADRLPDLSVDRNLTAGLTSVLAIPIEPIIPSAPVIGLRRVLLTAVHAMIPIKPPIVMTVGNKKDSDTCRKGASLLMRNRPPNVMAAKPPSASNP